MTAQGAIANETGRALEVFVQGQCREHGVHIIKYGDRSGVRDIFNTIILEKRVPYTSIYGKSSYSEFVLHDDLMRRSVRIECRWQEKSGSIDEKMPYLYLNAVESYPEKEIILLLDGDGAHVKAVNWIRVACNTKRYNSVNKIIQVQTMGQFTVWLRGFCERAPA